MWMKGVSPFMVFAQAFTDDLFIEFEWITDSLVTKGIDYYLSLPDSGMFDLELAAYSTLTGCSDTLLKKDMIRVFPKPLAYFDVDYPVAIIGQSDLRFTNKTLLANNFLWDFGDGFTSSERNPRHNFTEMGKYSLFKWKRSLNSVVWIPRIWSLKFCHLMYIRPTHSGRIVKFLKTGCLCR
jgi:hypothetical protein